MELIQNDKSIGTIDNLDDVKFGNKNIPFIFRGEELIHPLPIMSGLQLWYDFSGMTNNDASKGIATDLSGNGNHGTLQNFKFTPESGYDKNKLLFDGVDDLIEMPLDNLYLNHQEMTVQINNNIYSYNNERVFSVQDSVVDGGRNLFKLTNLVFTSNSIIQKDIVNGVIEATNTSYYIADNNVKLNPGIEYRISVENIQNSSSSRKDSVSVQVNNKTNSSVVVNLGYLSKTSNDLTFTITQEQYENNNGIFSIALYVSGSERTNARIEKILLVENKEPTQWSLPPEDSMQLISTVNKQILQSYKIYNRPLTPLEIAHNYAIEKERFVIE